MADVQVCVVCSHHVVLNAPSAGVAAGIHVAYGFVGDTLVADYWIHFDCIREEAGSRIDAAALRTCIGSNE